MRSIYYSEHTREQLTRLAKEGAMVVVPLAATEQHGPHLPVAVDSLITEYIVERAVRQANCPFPLLIAPLLAIGCSEHHLQYGGTLSWSSGTYLRMLQEIGESLAADGFRRLLFLNGHGGNEAIMRQAATDLAVGHELWVAAASYWAIAGGALHQAGADADGIVPGHAGQFETSLMLAIRPELVDRSRIPAEHPVVPWIGSGGPGVFLGKHDRLTGRDGFTDASAKATAERGAVYLQLIVDRVADWIVAVCGTMEAET
ncbi:creatininase family protein [Paenibacillus koleovorans]|uniref:creatininase family protein n=1 Tax=Paenibacillus koleovorans TaxID=121608 RepID=UPI000FDA4724|nr:creatininase family protein [Paenibacillus koleovorans]